MKYNVPFILSSVLLVAVSYWAGTMYAQLHLKPEVTEADSYTVKCVHQDNIWERNEDAPTDLAELQGSLEYYHPLGKGALQCNEDGEWIGDFVPTPLNDTL